MSAPVSATVALTWSPEEVTTALPGKALPSSSAVRRTPVAPRRSRVPLQWLQRQAGAGVEHQRHCGTAELPDAPATANGPWQDWQRAGSRHVSQASEGAYPERATWTSTGPRSRPSLAV